MSMENKIQKCTHVSRKKKLELGMGSEMHRCEQKKNWRWGGSAMHRCEQRKSRGEGFQKCTDVSREASGAWGTRTWEGGQPALAASPRREVHRMLL
jgi:hypothetical protein